MSIDTEDFVKEVSNATQAYIDGEITSVQYLLNVTTQVEKFDDTYKELEQFKLKATLTKI